MSSAFQRSSFQNNSFQGTDAVAPAQTVGGGRGGVNPWPGRTERSWDKWWQKEHSRRQRLLEKRSEVEKQVEALQVDLRDVRRGLQEARDLDLIQRLLRRLHRLQALLDKQQGILDDLEMQEAMLVWELWSQQN